MKLVKSLLLGSAAGLCAVAGAQAADLPVRKAAPVEYVRVCTAYGAGFFYIPGTDTCLKVGGRARFEYYFSEANNRASQTGFRTIGRVALDARTATAYGALRTFVRIDISSRTGSFNSGSAYRKGDTTLAGGVDISGQAQKVVEINDAYVQWAGFTAGRTSSFFDFYQTAPEIIGSSTGSSVYPTNLLAYTATFGNGFSATLSIEDPIYRRNAIFSQAQNGGVAGAFAGTVNTQNFALGGTPLSFIGNTFTAAGVPTSAVAIGVNQINNMPDFVGVLRYDQAWGSAQVSAAVHEIRLGNTFVGAGGAAFGVNGGAAAAINARPITPAEYGWAVQGGLKLNVPQLAPGDALWLQVGYGQGALSYTGITNTGPYDLNSSAWTNRFAVNYNDGVVDAFGRMHLTESYSGTISFLHYWSPEWRSAIFASHGQVIYDSVLRTFAGPAGGTALLRSTFDPTLKSYGITWVGGNLIWSPVKDLDIGVEVAYGRVDIRGRVFDGNKGGAVTGRTIGTDDNIQSRIRVQRDF